MIYDVFLTVLGAHSNPVVIRKSKANINVEKLAKNTCLFLYGSRSRNANSSTSGESSLLEI